MNTVRQSVIAAAVLVPSAHPAIRPALLRSDRSRRQAQDRWLSEPAVGLILRPTIAARAREPAPISLPLPRPQCERHPSERRSCPPRRCAILRRRRDEAPASRRCSDVHTCCSAPTEITARSRIHRSEKRVARAGRASVMAHLQQTWHAARSDDAREASPPPLAPRPQRAESAPRRTAPDRDRAGEIGIL